MPPIVRSRAAALASLAVLVVLAAPTDALACPQHDETYHAEANSLPCVLDTQLGLWPRHTPEFHATQAAAFDYALTWAPYSTRRPAAAEPEHRPLDLRRSVHPGPALRSLRGGRSAPAVRVLRPAKRRRQRM